MNYAYVRVSTEQQSCSSQKFEITNWTVANGIAIDKWIQEEVSGTVPIDKRKLGAAIRRMKKGDLLICTEISRLGRSVLMIMGILNECAQKGICIRTIKDNFDLSGNINSKIIAFAFALAAEIERNLISQRTKEALARKKSEGVVLGRPVGRKTEEAKYKLFPKKTLIAELLKNGVSQRKIAKICKVDRNTLGRYIHTFLKI